MTDFLMPSLGADMESGTVVEWLVGPGSHVRKGDAVAIVETHKGAIEVEIFEEGEITELCVQQGEEVPVGALLARLTRTGEEPGERPQAREEVKEAPAMRKLPPDEDAAEKLPPDKPAAPERAPAVSEAPTAPAEPKQELRPEPPAPEVARSGRVKVSPAARRRAAQLGIDPATLHGTGLDGSVTLADVEVLASAAPKPKVTAKEPRKARPGFDPLQMRQAIAAAMARSKREIPHYYLTSTIDMTRALAWLEAFNGGRSPDERLLPAALLLKATAQALKKVPQFNGFWEDGKFRPGPGIHVGWAIALRGGGLVAPAVHDADGQALPELMAALRDLVGRARGGGLRSSELTDPTITITSLGERGAESVLGVIYPPQVAIVGFGCIAERPWMVDGRVETRPLVAVSLAGDHRASDGHTGGQLLAHIDRLLQEPEGL